MTVAVGLCSSVEEPSELDLLALRRRLRTSLPDVAVELVPDLGWDPARIRKLASSTGAGRLVLGLLRPEATARKLRAWSRDAGLDPFAVELVDLERFLSSPQAAERAALVLEAAVARLRAFEGSGPGELKLELLPEEGPLSRRSLLTLPRPAYRPVPSIRPERCLGARRCGLCLPACPIEAIAVRGGRPVVAREACESCGICVTACPAAAIRYPGASLAQYEAELATLLSTGSLGLVFGCRAARQGNAPLPAGWLPVDVPCLGMITPAWLLQALAAGAPAVALVACSEGCRLDEAAVVEERVGYVRTLLALLGEESPTERVRTSLGPPPPLPRAGQREAATPRLALNEPAGTAEAALALAQVYGAEEDGLLAHDASPLGLVELVEETCAACGSCAFVCPTGALAFENGDNAVAVSFDATACLACGRCAAVCPVEGTLRVRRATDLAALRHGRVTLKHDTIRRCQRCGQPVASEAMLERIRVLLGDAPGEGELADVLTSLCADCRALGVSAAVDPRRRAGVIDRQTGAGDDGGSAGRDARLDFPLVGPPLADEGRL